MAFEEEDYKFQIHSSSVFLILRSLPWVSISSVLILNFWISSEVVRPNCILTRIFLDNALCILCKSSEKHLGI